MASKKKQKGMVFHQEGATTPAAALAADHPTARFVVPKPGKASEGGMERSTCVTNEETGMKGKPNMYPSKESIRTSGGLPAAKHSTGLNPQLDNLSPDSICKGIRVTLDNNSMWNEFFRCKTEMILTQQGSRMFPYCRFRISGLQSSKKYSLIMDIQPLDNSRYKWTGKSWQVAGRAECHVKSQPFAHPESPSTGQHWMQNPVSFYKLKLTNNISDQEGNTILHPMHRYLPRLHVVQTDKAAKDIKLNNPNVVTFTFPQTEFMAVIAYQNSRFSQLKVDYNPFAKGLKEEGSSSLGLKLKLNSGKDLHKEGGTTTTEQHPVKKSLKSLLANHKPRSSKAVDEKPSWSADLQKNSTTNKDQSAANVTGECLRNSHPAQKLFSELIREAHVSLHRCDMEELGFTNSTSHRTERTNTKTTALKSNGQDNPKKDSISVKTQSKTSPAKKGEVVVSERKVKGDKDLLNSLNCKDNDGTVLKSEVNNVAAPAVSQNSSGDSDQQCKTEAPSEAKVKQHKRPAPLPLPALALFLKQHSTKSKVAKSKLDSSPAALPSESLSDSQSSAATPACSPSDQNRKAAGPWKDLTGYITKSNNQDSGHAAALPRPDEMVLNQPSSPFCPVATTDRKGQRTHFLDSVSVAESTGSELAVQDGTPVLPNSDQPSCTLGTSVSTISSTLATSSTSFILSPTLDTVLPAPNSPQTPTITESSTLPSDSPTMKSDSLLPDPECSSFGFEPLSPASSSEPLPSLPILLALDLDSTTSEPPPKAVSPKELQQSEDSAASVFKWHTVLPQSRQYMDTSFTTFQPTTQTLPLESVPSPLLPSQSPSHSEPQALDTSTSTSTSTPPPDSAPSFQENESLPFPAELSPLALHLPLSPTFSSLDGDALSPTPSIADLVHFFSTEDDFGMEVEFSNTEAVAAPCPPPSAVEANIRKPSQQVQPAKKPCKGKKKSQRQKLAKTDVDQNMDVATYTNMRPNLEEVEEQLFISFTSKEALKLHIADSSVGTVSQPQTTPECQLQETADAPENVETAESLEEKIAAYEKILLRDLKLMRHRQVIHPVLQEVGLKLSLLDPTLAIDLQYLGVRLPIPPPGVSLEPLTQELPPSQGVSAAFVSRTGKTTDVTQIKGWRGKFTPSEAPPPPTATKPEAGPSSDPPKKNLSAFCSDMLDEYLENEGKLIDERAASFSQPQVEPVVYELPTRSTSYVRTLNSVLKKQPSSFPTSDLISGFVPPSKRPKLPVRETKTSRKGNMRQKGPKHHKYSAEPGLTAALSPAESNLFPKQSTVPTATLSSEHTAPVTEPHTPKKHRLKVQLDHTEPFTLSSQPKKRKKLKPKTLSQTLSPLKSTLPQPGVSEDMAPLESDSELGTAVDQNTESSRQKNGLPMTRAMLKQKDLEDEVVWGGRPRTSITEERATVALTSLFTLMGFVSENPTAPIQLVRRQAPLCLNEFCRLGCVCSSLSHCVRISHCGRPQCMLGCSCLKQKVVLLKNLDASDSSPSQQGNVKKKKRKRRMKMAYILKEADSVSQPAERVRVLWKRDSGDLDPDPINVPKPAALSRPPERRQDSSSSSGSSCARVRAYRGKKTSSRKQKTKDQLQSQDDPPETSKDEKSKKVRLKPLKQRDLTLKSTETKPSSPPPAADPLPLAPSAWSPSPPSEPPPKPSKRLIILAECKWENDSDRSLVLKNLCEAMAWDRLDEPFWIKNYLISPISQTVEDSGGNRCIQYKIHISRPLLEPEKPVKPVKPPQQRKQRETTQQQEHLEQVVMKAEPVDNWQQEVAEDKEEVEEAEPLEDWQREVMEEEEEAEPLEDWQREVEEDDIEEEAESTDHQLHDGRESGGEETNMTSKKTKRMMVSMALPFLTGISPAGFLSASKKQQGGTDHLVQVNGKLYPLAKIQLGRMGALHPANRLAAYLTGRVALNKKPQSSSFSPSKPPQNQSSAPTVSSSSSVVPTPTPKSQPSATIPTSLTDSQVSSSAAPPVTTAPKGSQVFMVQVPPPPAPGKLPVPAQPPGPPPPSSSSIAYSSGQRIVLQPVQMASGLQYYRKPDGKLVRLVPLSQLRSVNLNQSTPQVLPAASLQPPVVTAGNQKPPPATATSTLTSVSPLSGLQSFKVSPLTSQLRPASGFLSQKGTCTFKILPANNNMEPMIITCPKVPPKVVSAPGSFTVLQPQPPNATPVNLISLKPSTGQGAELGVKTVTVSAVPVGPVGPDGVIVHQKPAIQIPYRPPPPAPPESEVTPAPPPKPEPACNLLDLDIICVDYEEELDATETGGEVKQPPDVVEVKDSSSETENSSDFSDESAVEEEKEPTPIRLRFNHNMLEKQRRRKLWQLFEALRREVGLSKERTSKVSTLKKSVEVIQELWRTEKKLEKKKEKLLKRRDNYLAIIAPITGSKDIEVVDLLDDTDEPENSFEEERPVTKTTNAVTVSEAEDEVQIVAVETVEESSQLNTAQKKLASILRKEDSDVKKLACVRSLADAFKALQSVMNTNNTSRSFLLEQEIQTLQSENGRLRSLKICLNQQRDAYIREVSQRSGKSKERIRSMLQHLSSKQKEMEMQERLQAANQLQAAVGGGSYYSPTEDSTDDVIIITSSSLQQQCTPQAPPTFVSVPPTNTPSSTPVQTSVQTPVQAPVQQPQRVLQVSRPILAPPGVSHSVSVVRDRPRTVPNILSRSKNPAASQSIKAVVPAEVLSLVGTALSGQPVLTLSQMMTAPTLLQTSSTPGVASVTLNISNLASQQIHLTSLPHPPTATDLNNLLQLVQPSTTPQQQQLLLQPQQPPQTKQQILQTPPPPPPPPPPQQQQQQILQPPQETQQQQPPPPPPQQQQIPEGPPPSPPAPLLVVSSGSDPITDQDQPPFHTDTTSEAPPSTQDPSSTPCPGASADRQAEVTEAGPVGAEPQQETRDDESLTSLLNEIVFLNQQAVTTAETPLSGKPSPGDDVMDEDEEYGRANSPWLLELDSDSDETIGTEMGAAAVNDHTDMTPGGPQLGPVNGNAKGGVLAPPPLLQMKVGGAKVADPASCDEAAGGEGEGEGGGKREGGVAWRPMPRLVPLGLRGNPPS
ncbi:hypothetical protein ABVT39_011908 [Epinephelus coioides]